MADADADLKARLESHERSFEGMMSLIPADLYYGKDNSDQWKRKKQTKEEKRAAKMAKLEPGANKTALDVHKAKQLKRKNEDDVNADQPEKLSGDRKAVSGQKKQKTTHPSQDDSKTTEQDLESKRLAKVEKRKQKRQEKNARRAKKKEKLEAKRAKKTQQSVSGQDVDRVAADDEDEDEDDEDEGDDDGPAAQEQDMDRIDMTGLEGPQNENGSVSSDSHHSTTFDINSNQSSVSSSSSLDVVPQQEQPSKTLPRESQTIAAKPKSKTSIHAPKDIENDGDLEASSESDQWEDDPASVAEAVTPNASTQEFTATVTKGGKSDKAKALNLPDIDPEELQKRLRERIAAFRNARHADGPNGRPARSRAELIEARRRKDDQRKAHKKELRAKARLAKDAEEEAARLRGGSGSPLWSPGNLPSMRKEDEENQFTFGRVAFEDGAEANATLSEIHDARKKKGPQDTKGALAVAEKKKARLASLDSDKRRDIAEKDAWLNASKRVHGEKIRDDANLLKKTLKRQDKAKAKSESEWQGREDAVRTGKEAKQKRREENLAKRRDEKKRGKGGSVRFGIKFGGSKGGAKSSGKPKKRPGFEGSFKSGGRNSKP